MPSKPIDCSVIIPTHNRAAILDDTLRRLVALPDRRREIIVVDNGSTDATAAVVRRYPSARWIELGRNHGCAARNIGAMAASGRVLLMLDDDSWPEPGVMDGLVRRFDLRPELGAVACRVRLVDQPHRHDAGGVPGIFFNCGGAVRRDAFISAGGFPIDFDYYVEEYDLACRLLKAGWWIEPHGDLLVWHRRVIRNRDNNRMLRLLVRNNLRLWDRYAPEQLRQELRDQTIERYRRVARKEGAMAGYLEGMEEGRRACSEAPARRSPLSSAEYAALFGLEAAQEVLADWADKKRIRRAAIFWRAKACEQLIDLAMGINIRIDAIHDDVIEADCWRGISLRSVRDFDPSAVDGVIVGSLSPGVAEDFTHDFHQQYPEIPVISAAPWALAGGPRHISRATCISDSKPADVRHGASLSAAGPCPSTANC